MGGSFARRLAERGFDLVVHDARPEVVGSGGRAAPANSPADVAARADIIITALPGSREVEQVALGEEGIIHGLRPGTAYVNMSTCSHHQVDVLGAPVNGGPTMALAGKLAIVVGGSTEALERCRPVLEALGQIRHVGGVGAGETVKIINNLLLGVMVPATAEALVLGVKAGIDPDALVDAIENGVGDNHALRKHFKQHELKGDFSENDLFSDDFMRKDLDLALDLGNDLKVPLLFGGLANQVYQGARAAGRADNYHPVIVTLLEELVGVEVRSKG
jgi:3-hydroxyisobutyrate dehydrogenase-like beta-hydroxyacid dehydrogenase